MNSIFIAIKRMLIGGRYLAIFILITAIVFSALFAIQVKTVPGNSGQFQIAIFSWKDWAILAAISVLNSLFITIEIYAFNLKRSIAQTGNLGASFIMGGVGSVRGRGTSFRLRRVFRLDELWALAASFGMGTSSSILASIFSTASCSLCVSAIFGFLGANSVVFLVDNRNYVVFVTIALLLLSLFLSAKRFHNVCQKCKIEI